MNILDYFHGSNAGYVLELYERYLEDPNSVDPKTRAYFEKSPPTAERSETPLTTAVNGQIATAAVPDTAVIVGSQDVTKAIAVANLAQAIREYGHLDANSNPLYPLPSDPSLKLESYGLTEADLKQVTADAVGGPLVSSSNNAHEAIQQLRDIYCSGAGYDYDHLRNPEIRAWLRDAAESRRFRQAFDPDGQNAILLLKRLVKVETFEQFLHKTFVGKKRFSIEGLDMLVPVLDEIVMQSAKFAVQSIIIGMAHRGRLNVMAHVLNKDYLDILREFKDPLREMNADYYQGYLGQTGDVKYHKGAFRITPDSYGVSMAVKIAPNPSHLELVNPIVEGMARATDTDTSAPGAPKFNHQIAMPIQIHGDAAFGGQGTVAETLNFSDLEGYTTGGTIHIIANNQVGFTTNPKDSRGSLYASDLAKGFKMPIVHVNANDPVACLEVARLAVHYRNTFHKDFMIDLVGYRRYGHNEGDEPRFTQPMMYDLIDELPTVREIWGQELIQRGFITAEDMQAFIDRHWNRLQVSLDSLDTDEAGEEEFMAEDVHKTEPGIAKRTETAVPADQLKAIHQNLVNLPQNFTINSRLQRVWKRRASALDEYEEKNIDWGTAEMLAFATILSEGTPIRLTGEDVKRGTFSHRHAVLFDNKTGDEYSPLQTFEQSKAAFEVYNSPLTESATIGFEYGYNIERPERLVVWEAQFGDFVNGAQMMIDEYLSSGRAKWNQTPSLVLLLPHGYEGQGPDHSSARLERFLQLTAEKNMRVINCSTAAQYFHIMRRQALLLEKDPLPLIVMSPKSLLRHPMAACSLKDLVEGRWQPVIDDPDVETANSYEQITRLVLCSGKVYVDLISSDLRAENQWVSIARVEQLYPFPKAELIELFDKYPNLAEVIWLQEEPRNMGAYRFMQPRIGDILPHADEAEESHIAFHYIGRQRYASPAEGSTNWHKANQDKIVRDAFTKEYVDEELRLKQLTS